MCIPCSFIFPRMRLYLQQHGSTDSMLKSLGATQVDYATWFGNHPEHMHAIQYIPFTPISEVLLRPDWMRGSLAEADSAFTRVVDPINTGFRLFLTMGQVRGGDVRGCLI